MNNSVYLKEKLNADRVLSLSLDRGIKGTIKSAKGTIESVYSGAERASWYTSCFFEKYASECQEIKSEDKRVMKAISEIYKRSDVIYDMIKLYIDYVLEKNTPRENMRSTTYYSVNLGAKISVTTATKKAMAYSIAKTVSESISMSNIVRTEINRKGLFLITSIDLYGKVQKSAMAARRLQIIDPGYYNSLRANNIEMLYIYIDPIISKASRRIHSNSNLTFDEVVNILNDMGR
ncbi:hypothetical protein BZ17_631 [Yersinia pseudotuberculosis IP 32953]|nr:hypothetical protein [Yersinia pseudotuberculosis]AIN15436.1 hypothetical protein DJ40_463 [Yersinia pseudotuberculosis]AJJ56346.1 hypothetical protein BZ17_631 [Yersinia pseudotuberculosis IP 32953]AJJ60387.1 hypothetical protein BZ22_2887 [Yersinia pseudotuberculosis YPIII]AJJ71054.1 hypothetical protein BZ23_1391 [Yersinia pseudotuberculosis]AYW88272.1 hypothetical protein EGX87_14430 [Yersinia pseudotuberculosis]